MPKGFQQSSKAHLDSSRNLATPSHKLSVHPALAPTLHKQTARYATYQPRRLRVSDINNSVFSLRKGGPYFCISGRIMVIVHRMVEAMQPNTFELDRDSVPSSEGLLYKYVLCGGECEGVLEISLEDRE